MSDTPIKPVNVALIGLGEHARRNALPALEACASVRLVGLATRNREVLTHQASLYGVRAYDSAEALLADERVQAVYVALPTGLHLEWGKKVLAAGKHLWCEKSLGVDGHQALEMVALGRQRNLAVCECFVYPHHPQFKRIAQMVQDGALGTLRCITARFGFPHLAKDNIRYQPELGGGALLDAGVYPISAALELLDQRPHTLQGALERDPGYQVDTRGSAFMAFEGGVHALLSWGFGHAYRNEIELWGDAGTLRVERAFSKPPTLATNLTLTRQDGSTHVETIAAADQFALMFQAFAKAAQSGEVGDQTRERYYRQAQRQADMVQTMLDWA